VNDQVQEPGAAGSPVKEGRRARKCRVAAYRREEERLAPYRELARIVCTRRRAAGLTQQVLGQRMGTSGSMIARIESGWRTTRPETLSRLADALGMRFVMGFESGPAESPERELVTVSSIWP
jgi:ribosome-binding protein aMBF1 (putative translation factor)